MSIQKDIDRGLVLVKEIAELETELKAIKARIEKAALNGPQIPLEDAERDGMQYLARGTQKVVPVVITADFLVSSFGSLTPKHEEIRAALPNVEPLLTDFYAPKLTYERVIEDGQAFRKLAREMMPDIAEPFIQACVARDKHGIAKSAVKIGWDRAKEVARG